MCGVTDSFLRGKVDTHMYPTDVLGVLGLPEDLIADVRAMLQESSDALEGATLSPIGDVFGASAAGADLSHNASLARQAVAEAVTEMAQALSGMSTGLQAHVTRMADTDTQNGVDLNRINASADAIKTPNFHRHNGRTTSGEVNP